MIFDFRKNNIKAALACLGLALAIAIAGLTFTGCAPDRQVVQVVNGKDGAGGKDGKNAHLLVFASREAESGTLLDFYIDSDDSLSVTDGDTFYQTVLIPRGPQGAQGIPGTSSTCSAQAVEGGALLACDDQEPVFIANGSDGVGIPGLNGSNGTSCAASPAEGGVNITCGDNAPVFLANGATGSQGPTGPQGPAGPTGPQGPAGSSSSATITVYASSSCVSITGTAYYAKSGNVYDASGCSSSHKVATLTGSGTLFWVGTTTLAVDGGSGAIRVISFN